ncbi:MAG: arginine repressor [Candidatus Dormibacteria bacterium]
MERQRTILQLVRTRSIRTQSDLVAALQQLRLDVTQATVSRDIREMGLLRVRDAGGLRYVVTAAEIDAGATLTRLRDTIREHVRDMEFIDNIAVIHTRPSTAPLVGAALDGARFDEIAGTVAGDDTVLVVVRSRPAAQRLSARLREIVVSSR